jgi:hypothetical protein
MKEDGFNFYKRMESINQASEDLSGQIGTCDYSMVIMAKPVPEIIS